MLVKAWKLRFRPRGVLGRGRLRLSGISGKGASVE